MVEMVSERMPAASTRRLWLRLLGCVLLVLLAWVAWYLVWRQPALQETGPSPWSGPIPVRLVGVQRQAMDEQIKAIGTVTALQSVTVRSRVDGQLARVLFQEGQEVRRGQVLAEIDAAPFRVKLAQAEGLQQQMQAQLQSAERDVARYRTLLQQDSIARQQLETQEALVAQLRGSLANVRAQVQEAQLQLSYTRIEAPVAGRLGMRRVDAGNLVATADAQGLVSITQTHPITVLFAIPETQLPAVRAGARGARPLVVQAWDRAEAALLATGRLTTLDNQIDTATGTLRLKAQFDNADDALFPNQFVNVRLKVRTLENALVVPADAVQHGSQGPYVYTVRDGKAVLRRVALGTSDGERLVVTQGLAEGESVVLEGLDRLRDGIDVAQVVDGEPPQTAQQLQQRAKAQAGAASSAGRAASAASATASTAASAAR
ncbi:efflux RND transporter periplasmic adaptor subunit [Acidovorax sp. NCPPB 3576]|uniref:efflux RND transporter periplasmic adaptor subunit n=1 Tax=Acidovorax sp. NCPPB 3576 TaxID=2940488 RepID=UPI00234BA1F6|nr:efflux RND transporter periplasmic adaptor subunit [Acidovorax sp. NCPPB 3576]WCM88234.1 efflux RND transporter periplasmic adaptor subunit [Acidovorax sp. NCPPB 3576]